jgi:hypothetical protein
MLDRYRNTLTAAFLLEQLNKMTNVVVNIQNPKALAIELKLHKSSYGKKSESLVMIPAANPIPTTNK